MKDNAQIYLALSILKSVCMDAGSCENCPLYRKVKLRNPVTREIVETHMCGITDNCSPSHWELNNPNQYRAFITAELEDE